MRKKILIKSVVSDFNLLSAGAIAFAPSDSRLLLSMYVNNNMQIITNI